MVEDRQWEVEMEGVRPLLLTVHFSLLGLPPVPSLCVLTGP
jgi:hypothetical protein